MQTVVIVGIGALGSHLVPLLRNTGATLRVIDFDRVEQKNVASQFHGKTSVGKSKVLGLQQTMQLLFGVKLETIPHKLTSDNVRQLLGGADLVVDALDNGASRRVVQQFVRAEGIPCLHGALAADGAFGAVVWDSKFRIDDEPGEGVATCENGAHLPFIALTAALLAKSVQAFLEDGKQAGYSIHAGGVTRL